MDIIEFLIKKPNIFKLLLFKRKIRKMDINYITMILFSTFLEYSEKVFMYTSSDIKYNIKDNYIFITFDNKYTVHLTMLDTERMCINIYRFFGNCIESSIILDVNSMDKLGLYDNYIINTIFKHLKDLICDMIDNIYIQKI